MQTSPKNQILSTAAFSLNTRYGPLYAGIASITFLVLGHSFLENRYGFSDGGVSIQPIQTGENN